MFFLPSLYNQLAFICFCWLLFEIRTFEYWLLLLLLLLLSPLYSPKLIDQGEVGISATIMFEALTGERASSHLELHNEGSTAIFYSWQQLPMPHSFPNLQSQTKNPHFYFNSSSGTHIQHNQAPAATTLTSYTVCPCVSLSYLSTSTQLAILLPILLPLPSRCDPTRCNPAGGVYI